MINVTKLVSGESALGSGPEEQCRAVREHSGPVVVWRATTRSNLEYAHALRNAATWGSLIELTTAEARAMIEDLAQLGIPALVIAGGEPLLRPDIFDLIQHASACGIPVTLATNGVLIDDGIARRLARSGVTQVVVNLDGDEEISERMRGTQGGYAPAVRAIRSCQKAGIAVAVAFPITTGSVTAMESVFRLVEREGVKQLCLHHLVYAGQQSSLSVLDLPASQKRTLMNDVLQQVETWNAEGRAIEVTTADNDSDAPFTYYWLLDRDPARATAALSLMSDGGNRAGIDVAAIDSSGLVHPDEFSCTHSIGSVRERPFSAIWRDSRIQLLEQLRDRPVWLGGRCATCQWLSICNGNSRARAESATGDFWQSDPGCYLTDTEVVPGMAD